MSDPTGALPYSQPVELTACPFNLSRLVFLAITRTLERASETSSPTVEDLQAEMSEAWFQMGSICWQDRCELWVLDEDGKPEGRCGLRGDVKSALVMLAGEGGT